MPDLPLNGHPNAHYYDDVEKFAVCLPTKTGSTSWMKVLYSLSIEHGDRDPDDIDGSIVFKTPEMPRQREKLKEFHSNRTGDNKFEDNFCIHYNPSIIVAISQ